MVKGGVHGEGGIWQREVCMAKGACMVKGGVCGEGGHAQ